jgi:hypothetical protein
MDLSLNQNLSKDFKNLMKKVYRWKKNKNPVVTVETSDPSKPFKRVKTNEAWGKPSSFSMK